MNAPDRAGTSGSSPFAWPPFASESHHMSGDQVAWIRRVGFDFVRLSVCPGVFLEASDPHFDLLISQMDRNVRRFLSAGLSVIVDLHFTNAPGDSAKATLDGWGGPVRAKYLKLVQTSARLLARHDRRRVALEPFNEPPLYGAEGQARWSAIQAELHQAARETAPDLLLILAGAQVGHFEALLALDTSKYAGSNVAYTFHYYDPMLFTHQGEVAEGKYAAGLSWPSNQSNLQMDLIAADKTAAADAQSSPEDRAESLSRTRKSILSYDASRQGAEKVFKDFAAVAAWADRNHIARSRIVMGEFGVTPLHGRFHGAADESRKRWLSTVRMAAEKFGFPWALWVYSGGGMALFGVSAAEGPDRVILSALGLTTS
jgi:hypothetical protein